MSDEAPSKDASTQNQATPINSSPPYLAGNAKAIRCFYVKFGIRDELDTRSQPTDPMQPLRGLRSPPPSGQLRPRLGPLREPAVKVFAPHRERRGRVLPRKTQWLVTPHSALPKSPLNPTLQSSTFASMWYPVSHPPESQAPDTRATVWSRQSPTLQGSEHCLNMSTKYADRYSERIRRLHESMDQAQPLEPVVPWRIISPDTLQPEYAPPGARFCLKERNPEPPLRKILFELRLALGLDSYEQLSQIFYALLDCGNNIARHLKKIGPITFEQLTGWASELSRFKIAVASSQKMIQKQSDRLYVRRQRVYFVEQMQQFLKDIEESINRRGFPHSSTTENTGGRKNHEASTKVTPKSDLRVSSDNATPRPVLPVPTNRLAPHTTTSRTDLLSTPSESRTPVIEPPPGCETIRVVENPAATSGMEAMEINSDGDNSTVLPCSSTTKRRRTDELVDENDPETESSEKCHAKRQRI